MTTDQLLTWTAGRLEGPAHTFTGIDMVDLAGPSDLTFAGHARFSRKLAESKAAGAIVTEGLDVHRRDDQSIIWVKNADEAIVQVLEKIAPPLPLPDPGIHPTAVIAPTAVIGPNARIGPHVVIQDGATIHANVALFANVFIGAHAVVGENSVLWPNVVVRDRCLIGARCILHPGAVIGADGFGYRFIRGEHLKIPHIGYVKIEDDVEIGANTCIDRGKFSATVIGAGSKLDNLVQIGHNVRLGRRSILVGQVAIAGSTRSGDYLVMGGGAALSDHLTLGTGVQVAGRSSVTEDVPDGQKLVGTPARPAKDYFSELRAIRQISRLLKRVDQLEQRLSNHPGTPENDRP